MKRFLYRRTKGSRRLVSFAFVPLMLLATSVFGAPVTAEQAAKAATNFIVKRYPPTPKVAALTVTSIGSSRLAVQKVQPWIESGKTVGFVAALNPSGYVLLSADGEAPPVKLHTERGNFWKLPPGFMRVVMLELSEDLAALSALRQRATPANPEFGRQWSALLEPQKNPAEQTEAGAGEGTNLLLTAWNQDYPYNYYCPTGADCDASGGHAWAGCVPCAMSQIMRYWQQPAIIASDHIYDDTNGLCVGTHTINDAGMGEYDWDNMPFTIDGDSADAEKKAVGQLMYHAGVACEVDYGTSGTSAGIGDARDAFRDYFNYSCRSSVNKTNYSSAEWHDKIAADIDGHRPMFYAMAEIAYDTNNVPYETNGHAVVCDGYQSTNEIHLNLGWGPGNNYNTWYNIDSVTAGGITWTVHRVIFEITPPYIYVDPSYAGTNRVPFTTITKAYEAVLGHTTIRIYAGNYQAPLTLDRAVRLEAVNGIVRIGP
jgi:streptopain